MINYIEYTLSSLNKRYQVESSLIIIISAFLIINTQKYIAKSHTGYVVTPIHRSLFQVFDNSKIHSLS